MEVWVIVNPILKVLAYLACVGSAGSFLFRLHFKHHLTQHQLRYCEGLGAKSALLGMVVSALLFFAVAGNFGGDLASAVDGVMLQLALESKPGIAHLVGFSGFCLLYLATKMTASLTVMISALGALTVLVSFAVSGHSTLSGLSTQILLLIHLVGISFWLGALLPFRWICCQSDTSNLHDVAHRFGLLALGYVGCLIIAGLLYAYMLLGGFSPLFTSSYGNVLLVKIVMVAALLSLAALNKLKLVPMLEQQPEQGVRRFKSSVQFEILIAFFILCSSSLLTTSLTLPSDM